MLGPSSGGAFSDDLDQMFGEEVPSVSSFDEPRNAQDQDPASIWSSTLDEDVYITLKRDVLRVAANLQVVLLPYKEPEPTQTTIKPRGSGNVNPFEQHSEAGYDEPDTQLSQDNSAQKSKASSWLQPKRMLRDWDLWGPFVFVLLLASLLSLRSSKPSQVFSLVFCLLCFGSATLNLNVLLLGGNIMFFQSLSLIGYCLFPMDVAALLCLPFRNAIYRSLVLFVGVVWSCMASVPFVGGAVPPARRALAVYPVLLLFLSLAWLILVL